MKWIFLFLLAVLVPVLVGWLRSHPRDAPKVWALMGFLPFVLGPWNLYVAPYSWGAWQGYVKGIEVSALDAVALAVLLSRPRTRFRLPFKIIGIAYLVTALLSVLQANIPIAASFYPWQLARVFLLFAAVAKICEDERAPAALITGMVIGLGFQACYSVMDYASGATQAAGLMGHQNLLGMMSHFVAFPALAMLLAGRRGWIPFAGPVAGILVAITTASRATMGFAGIGYVMILVLSGARKWTSRKAMIMTAGVLALVVATPLALASLDRRLEASPLIEGYDERARMEAAAWMIIADNPMGVGANQYVVVTNTGGYSARAGIAWTSGSAHVHNAYLVVAAETGFIGLIAFMALLAAPVVVAFRCAWKNRKDNRGDLLLGLGVAILIVSAHSLYEWVTLTYLVQYMLAITAGLIAGIAHQLGYWGVRRKRRPVVAGPSNPEPQLARQGETLRPERDRQLPLIVDRANRRRGPLARGPDG